MKGFFTSFLKRATEKREEQRECGVPEDKGAYQGVTVVLNAADWLR